MARKQLVPTSEAENPSNGYNTIDEEMILMDLIGVAGNVGNNVYLEANGPFNAS